MARTDGGPGAGGDEESDAFPVLLWTAAADRRHAWCNEGWLDFTGGTLAEALESGWTEWVHPDDLPDVLEAYQDAYSREEPFSIEYRLRRSDGEFRWMLDRGVPRRGADGGIAGYAGSCVDIHELRSTLDDYRVRERQQAIVADLGRFALEVDDEQELLDITVKLLAEGLGVPLTAALGFTEDRASLEIKAGTGWDPVGLETTRVGADVSTLAGYTLATDGSVVCDDLRVERRFKLGAGLRAHDVVSAMSAVIRLPGRAFGVLSAYSTEPRAFTDDDVVFARSIANLVGASFARREVEEALRGRELEARLALAAGRMGSWYWDPASREVSWSPEMEAVYGVEPGQFEGTYEAFLAHVHPEDHAKVTHALEVATRDVEDLSIEHRAVMPDGSIRWFAGRGAPVRGADGGVTGWIGVGIDITESKQVEQELRDRELEARLAFAAGHMGSWRWNVRTNRGSWSRELEDLVGIERGSYDGTWESFVAPILVEDGPLLRDVIGAAAREGTEFAVEYRIRRSDGVIRWIESRGRAFGDEGEWIGVSIDVTDRRRVAEQLREANGRLEETVGRLDTLLAHAPLGFAFYDRDLRFVRVNQPLAEINGLSIEDHLGRPISDVLPDVGPAVERTLRAVLETGAPISDVELSGQTPAQPGVERHWLGSYYPVRGSDDSPLGLGAIVVEITERKRQERAARLVGAVSELLAATPDLDDLLQRAASIMVPDLADSCAIYLLPRTDVARRFAISHVDPALAQMLTEADERWPLDIPRMLAASEQLRSGTPVMVTEVTPEMRDAFSQGPEHRSIAERLGVQSSIVAPLHVGDDVVGLLCLDYTAESQRKHQPDDVALVETLADRIVLVLERAYLTREAQRARARLDLLAQVSELLTVGLDTRVRLEAVTEIVLPTFADACVAYLVGAEGLQLAACKLVDERLNTVVDDWMNAAQAEIEGSGPIAEALRTLEAVLVSEVATTPGSAGSESDLVERLGLRSVLVVPLLSGDEPIGALAFGYTVSGRRYGLEDLSLAREIARRVAPAVEDAMRFERELATAEVLQRSLLPDRLPELENADLAARYVPGGVGLKVGGDWYDAVPLRDGRVMLVIGDVVGHGVPAAASMGKLRNVLQYSALDGLAPAAVLQRLNTYFCSLMDADMATLLVAEYDPARQRIRYSNAGHPPALLRLPDGTVEALEGGRSMPLCASDQAKYREAERDLPAGSMLVLYTDGLIERRGESLDIGLARLAEAIRRAPSDVEGVADALLRDLVADDAPADDIALLCIGTRHPAEALRLRLSAAPRQLARMRRAVSEWLVRAGASDEEAREIAVAVNEAAANAIEHAYGLVDADFVIEATQAGELVAFVVRDSGQWRTRRSHGDRGRGLDLARSLMDSVEVQPGAEGTVVRLQRRLRPSGGPA